MELHLLWMLSMVDSEFGKKFLIFQALKKKNGHYICNLVYFYQNFLCLYVVCSITYYLRGTGGFKGFAGTCQDPQSGHFIPQT